MNVEGWKTGQTDGKSDMLKQQRQRCISHFICIWRKQVLSYSGSFNDKVMIFV